MPKLQKTIEKQIQQVPRLALIKRLRTKLKDQGIENTNLCEALADHILTGNSDEFVFDDGNDDHVTFELKFTRDEADELVADIEYFLDNQLPKVLLRTIRKTAKSIVKRLEEEWPERRIDEVNETRWFKERLELRWQAGLDPLRMLLGASREVGQRYVDKLQKSKAKKGLIKREAIALLHMRACQTALEIITLLENGLADGAYSRWRTLYELTVVAYLIDKFGDDLAERYLSHDTVAMRKSLLNQARFHGWSEEQLENETEWPELRKEYDALLTAYGSSFASNYGWAAAHLDIKNPTFQDLEKAVDWNALPPDYKWSSFKVHAGVAGTIRTLASVGDQHFVHAGASNAGLNTPAINTANSLVQITLPLFGKLNDVEKQVQLQALINLRDKAEKQFRKAKAKLEADEAQLNDG